MEPIRDVYHEMIFNARLCQLHSRWLADLDGGHSHGHQREMPRFTNSSTLGSGAARAYGSPNHKYGSVKYNRVPSAPKEEVHETCSNPIMPVTTPFVVEVEGDSVDEGEIEETTSRNDNQRETKKKESINEERIKKTSVMSTLEAPSTMVPRQKYLSLLPPSLHISFDVEPENSQSRQMAMSMPLSQSSDNVRHYHRYGRMGGAGAGRGIARYPHSQRRNFLQQSDIAQISAGYMRASGAVQQFRRILAAPDKAPTLLSKFKQHSKEKEREPSKDESSTATLNKCYNNNSLCGGRGSFDDPKMTTPASMDAELGKHPLAPTANGGELAAAGGQKEETGVDELKPPVGCAGKRNRWFEQRRKACDYACAFAIFGIVLMILENELSARGVYTKSSAYSYALKCLLVLSTLALLVLILAYHALELQLCMFDLGCNDWRILISTKRAVQIVLELLACSICPVPGDYHFTWRTVHHDGKTVTAARVPVDVLLSIPMFLRVYLFCRLMLLHSKLFTDAASRSIGAMNRVNFTARFVLKTLMTMSPGTVLLTFTMSWWLTAAWIMLLCERYHGYPYYAPAGASGEVNNTIMNYEAIKHQNYLNSLWLVAITSLTIGYGDIVPNTYCGRAVSVICGIVGAGTSSLVVAVVARKLELSCAEKYVHNFMMDSVLTKKLKNAAANVLRETWLIYKNRKLVQKVDASKIRYHQRKFLNAIYVMRQAQREQMKLNDNLTSVAAMAKTTSIMREKLTEMQDCQREMDEKLAAMDQRCANVEAYMRQLQISIRVLPELVARKLQPSSSTANKHSSQATSLCDSHPPSAAQSTDAQNGSGYSTPE